MLALLALAAPTASAQRQTTTSTAAAACTPNPEADLSGSLSADGMSGTVRNTSATCAYQVGIAAYRMFDNVIDNQELYDHKVATIAPGATIRFSVSLPNCKVQVDLFYGNVLLSLKGQRYGDRLLSAKIMGTTYCTRDAGCTLTQGYWKNHVKACGHQSNTWHEDLFAAPASHDPENAGQGQRIDLAGASTYCSQAQCS